MKWEDNHGKQKKKSVKKNINKCNTLMSQHVWTITGIINNLQGLKHLKNVFSYPFRI